MTIDFTPEQYEELIKDRYLDIRFNEDKSHSLYIEVDESGRLEYFEYITGRNKFDSSHNYALLASDLDKLKPQRPGDPSYYRNDPLCPHCGSYMLYHFEHCPKCGQKLDWSEK